MNRPDCQAPACTPAPTPVVLQDDRPVPLQAELLPVVVVLDRLRSAFNVGNILRLADAVRVCEVVTCGYTATPPHPKLARTARGCDTVVPCRHAESAAAAVRGLLSAGYTVYGVETAVTARLVWETPLRFPAAFVLGNEALGIDPAVLAGCSGLVRLPAVGVKNSINVGNCAAVVLCEAWRQWRQAQTAAGGRP